MAEPRLTFLLDVDNTLLDNDAAKRELDARIADLLGPAWTARFWELYEVVRRDEGMVNIPLTMARMEATHGAAPTGAAADAGELGRERRFALADLLMGFRYDRFLFPGALDAIAHLRELGRVAILTEGDPTFQPSKIWRAGLDAAVDGYVLVFDQKVTHLEEVVAAFPADHYVLVEDKPDVITEVRARLDAPLTTVLVRQGKYAATVPPGSWSGAHLTLERIGDLRELDAAAFVRAAETATVSTAG
jgi:FMN phosphatase YigB (HAD superfamily)